MSGFICSFGSLFDFTSVVIPSHLEYRSRISVFSRRRVIFCSVELLGTSCQLSCKLYAIVGISGCHLCLFEVPLSEPHVSLCARCKRSRAARISTPRIYGFQLCKFQNSGTGAFRPYASRLLGEDRAQFQQAGCSYSRRASILSSGVGGCVFLFV